ncbi:MAG: hypothetical protein IPP07_06110 [Holophagales bacterium]|nr:hypothetical protein [Holophagales bacterium]
MKLLIPVSAGELIDKITILRLKAERIGDPVREANVRRELALLETVRAGFLGSLDGLAPLMAELQAVNAALWDVEEGKRDCERRQDFRLPAFVALARSVYLENDRRAALSADRRPAGSDLVEEKSHRP